MILLAVVNSDMPPEVGWLRLVAEGGSLIIVAWVVYWILSKVIPDMNKQFAETTKQQREDHLKANKEQQQHWAELLEQSRKDYLGAIADQRKDFGETLTRERGALTVLTEAINKCTDRLERHDNDMKVAHNKELEILGQHE